MVTVKTSLGEFTLKVRRLSVTRKLSEFCATLRRCIGLAGKTALEVSSVAGTPAEVLTLKTFCAYPFAHIDIRFDARASLCCRTNSHIKSSGRELSLHHETFDQIWNSDYMRETRWRMVSGKPVEACTVCYRAENEGAQSLRTHANHPSNLYPLFSTLSLDEVYAYGKRLVTEEDAIAPSPSSIRFQFGNLCNLKCRMCNAENSSLIAADAVHSRWIGGVERKAVLLPEFITGVEYFGFGKLQNRDARVYRLLHPGEKALISLPSNGDPIGRIKVSGYYNDAHACTLFLTLGDDRIIRQPISAPDWAAEIGFDPPIEMQPAICIGLEIEGSRVPIGIQNLTLITAPTIGKAFPREFISRFPENPSWFDNEDLLLKEIMGSPERLRFINFAGGEPMLQKKLETFLEVLVEKGVSKNIFVYISTNGTQRGLAISRLLKHFSSFWIGLSVDGTKNIQEYIRPPSKWRIVSENILRYRDDGINYISVCATPQAYNVYGLMDLIEFCDVNDLDFSLKNILNEPRFLSFDMLPQVIVNKALNEWREYRRKRCRPHLLSEVDTLIAALGRPRPSDIEELQDNFIRFTNDIDKTRGQSLAMANPRLHRELIDQGFSFEGKYRYS